MKKEKGEMQRTGENEGGGTPFGRHGEVVTCADKHVCEKGEGRERARENVREEGERGESTTERMMEIEKSE